MATATTFVGTANWNAEVYGSLSVSSRLSALIASSTAQVKIVVFFWKVNRSLEGFLGKIDKSITEVETGKSKSKTPPATRESVEKAVDQLMDLYAILNGIHCDCIRHRLNNVSRLAVGIGALRHNADRIEELAGWLQDVINKDYKTAFSTALAEFENGETVPVSEVCR